MPANSYTACVKRGTSIVVEDCGLMNYSLHSEIRIEINSI